ncbi:MAG: response regulator [Armatimonadota bacterium]
MNTLSEPTKHTGRRALVVDDEPQVGQIMGRVLEQMGYAVDFALDGEQAVSLTDAQAYDIVVCDLLMPRLNGMALYDIWSARAPALIPHTIFVTGDNLGAETTEFIRRTARPCIFKPFRLHDLADVVAGVQKVAGEPPLSRQ